jgi:hypothetical protein
MGRLSSFAAVALFAAGMWAADRRPTPNGQPAPGARTAAPASPARPTIPRPPDKQLEAIIRAKFAKSKISVDKFTVHVQGGVATIEGETNVIQHKGTATRMAKTAGAVAVNNHVRIGDAARQKAAGNLEEGRRRVQIKRGDARGEPRQQAAPPVAQTQAQKKTQ